MLQAQWPEGSASNLGVAQYVWQPRSHWSHRRIFGSSVCLLQTMQPLHAKHCHGYDLTLSTSSSGRSMQLGWPRLWHLEHSTIASLEVTLWHCEHIASTCHWSVDSALLGFCTLLAGVSGGICKESELFVRTGKENGAGGLTGFGAGCNSRGKRKSEKY